MERRVPTLTDPAESDLAESDPTEAGERSTTLRDVARWSFIATIVAVGVVVMTLALWKLKLMVGLLFLAITIAAAMRPGVDAVARRRVPRIGGILVVYLVLLGLIALLLSYVVPHLVTQVDEALTAAKRPGATTGGGGIKDEILAAINTRLRELPTGRKLIHPAVSAGRAGVEIVVAILFTFACAAYWIFERDRVVDLVTRLLPRPKRKKVRDTWDLIDAKLGAYVRGQLLLIALVGIVVSAGLWLINEPYWLLLGIATGILEVVPVIGPLAAVALTVGVGLTQSWHTAALAAAVVLGVRLLEDYLVMPRILGGAVGLSPLIVIVSVFGLGILLGGFYILLAIPLAAAIATIIDVVAFGTDPADVDTPTVLLSAGDDESS